MIVYCVLCLSSHEDECGANNGEVVHIFSTKEKALEFSERDKRNCVLYDYMLDCPERMEQTFN